MGEMFVLCFCLFSLFHSSSLVTYTSQDGGPWFNKGETVQFGNAVGETQIEIFPETQLQEIWGIGSAMTEAAASNFVQLSPGQQEKLALAYYDPVNGIGTTMARTHINSADFSIEEYTYVTNDDPNLSTFNIDRERKCDN
jgi:glucosylceramidase